MHHTQRARRIVVVFPLACLPSCASADSSPEIQAGIAPAATATQAASPVLCAGTPTDLASLLSLIERGEMTLERAQERLTCAATTLDAQGPLDERMIAHAALARLHQAVGRPPQAAREFALVRSILGVCNAPAPRIRGEGPARGGRMRWIGKSLSALAEALFFDGEQFGVGHVEPI